MNICAHHVHVQEYRLIIIQNKKNLMTKNRIFLNYLLSHIHIYIH